MYISGAEFKQAAVVMTLETDEATATDCSADETAENILRKRWSDIGQVRPIVKYDTISVLFRCALLSLFQLRRV